MQCRFISSFRSSTSWRRGFADKTLLSTSFSSLPEVDNSRAFASSKKTPLFSFHEANKGKMIGFAGWKLPLNFPAGVMTETRQTRASASLFDVSHMQQIRVSGTHAVDYLERLCVSNVHALELDAGLYTLLTNENGGIIDDLCMSRPGIHEFLLVCNAACAQKDIAHLESNIESAEDVHLDIIEDRGLVALQGPKAFDVLARLLSHDQDDEKVQQLRELRFFHSLPLSLCGAPCRVTRCGYTGEDGFEVSMPAAQAVDIAESMLNEEEVELAGLGARDALRLEAALCLYGQDIDDTVTPVEADLSWTIGKRRRLQGGFLGADVILSQLESGSERIRTGLVVHGPPARENSDIQDATDASSIGAVTSGCYSPTLNLPIAMGYVDRKHSLVGSKLKVVVRKAAVDCTVVKMPFVPLRYYRNPNK